MNTTTINLGGVNCYLLTSNRRHLLIDTGSASARMRLESFLRDAGCRKGNLDLIVLTHGDVDHVGNAAYLRETYAAKVAMHPDDAGMIERGDMSVNRKARGDRIAPLFRIAQVIASLSATLGKERAVDSFTPDLLVDDGFVLGDYGFDAQVVHVPGHSKGSIGILTAAGDFFCGDLIYNFLGSQRLVYYVDDASDWEESIDKLRRMRIKMIHPGHGRPFPVEDLPLRRPRATSAHPR